MFRKFGLLILTNLLIFIMMSVLINVLSAVFRIGPYMDQVGINYTSLMLFSFLWGMGGALISLFLSKKMAKWLMGVKVIRGEGSTEQLRWLKVRVKYYAQKARLRYMPEVGCYNSPEVNAFATGSSKNNALLAFSTGLLDSMDRPAIEGVIAHEVAHVASDDMVVMTLLQGVMNAFVIFISRVLASFAAMIFRDEEKGPSFLVQLLFTFLFDIILGILASVLVLWFSRYREYRADEKGARYVGKDTMIHTLQSLMRSSQQVEARGNHAMVSNFKIAGRKKWISLLSSHPPIEERIASLRQKSIPDPTNY